MVLGLAIVFGASVASIVVFFGFCVTIVTRRPCVVIVVSMEFPDKSGVCFLFYPIFHILWV